MSNESEAGKNTPKCGRSTALHSMILSIERRSKRHDGRTHRSRFWVTLKQMAPRQIFKRKAVRFSPDPGALAQIQLEGPTPTQEFQPTIQGLVADESSKGCGVVLLEIPDLLVGAKCIIQAGQLSPLRAEVRWRKQIDEGIIRLGLMYLE